MSDGSGNRRRYAVVGTGARAEMFIRSIVTEHAGTAQLVALADTNQSRMDTHNSWLRELGAAPAPTYRAADVRDMLDREKVDTLLVTTVDRVHDEYIVTALDAGRDVITEKPMTVDVARCRRILEAVDRTGGNVAVAFNYRYNPLHSAVRETLAGGEIGEIGSIHFEWLLDVRHGADYFRRWHRDKANSGGLMVHKASHHFDLVNWWLGAEPEQVFAYGRLFFYGERGRRHGYARDYDRAHDAPAARDDPFALRLAENPKLRALYLDAEAEDGYHRDQNVFAPGVTIEDDMAVLARYSTGATMSYHLTAYAPWEGYRVMVNGSRGRLELEVVESDFVSPDAAREVKGASPRGQHSAVLHGERAAAEEGWATLTVRRFWEPPRQIPVPGYTRHGHGGADVLMTGWLFGAGAGGGAIGGAGATGGAAATGGAGAAEGAGRRLDPLGRGATARDGALALLTGLAANRSFETGAPVTVADLLDPH